MRDLFCLQFGLVSNQLIGGIEDHLAGHINRDGISKKIVNQRMFPRGEEEDKLCDGENQHNAQHNDIQVAEEQHHHRHDWNHGFHRVFAQHCADKKRHMTDSHAVIAHQSHTEYLFAQGLSVFEKERNEEF